MAIAATLEIQVLAAAYLHWLAGVLGVGAGEDKHGDDSSNDGRGEASHVPRLFPNETKRQGVDMTAVRRMGELLKAGLALFIMMLLSACSDGYSAKVGEAAPEIGAIDLNGNTVKIADLRGHVAILNFWQGGCAPCLTEMPIIQRVYEKHRKDGVRVVSVNIGGGPHVVRDTVEETKVTYNVAVDELFIASTRYNVTFFPTTYIIDKKGIIRERLFGEVQQSTLEEKIAPLL